MTGAFVLGRKPIVIERGDGVELYDDEGAAYLDAGASYACTPVGHSHPTVVEAVTDQLERLGFVQGSYPTGPRDALVERLADLAPGDTENVWLCNSGSEAVEAALKFARSATDRNGIVAAKRAFHGRTAGALSVTWKDEYREPYGPLLEDVTFVEYGEEAALQAAVDDETAAVILEPIQGEGGVRPAPAGYLPAARRITAEAGAALVLDEVQTGVGRTGTTWACEDEGVVPDVLTAAKGLASGLPMGATLCADWIAEGAGSHGSTFSGGPAVAAAADATLSVIEEEGLAERASERGEALHERLAELPVRDVRGRGLMVGVEVRRGAGTVLGELALRENVLATPAGRSVVRLLPPLTIEEAHVERIATGLETTLERIHA